MTTTPRLALAGLSLALLGLVGLFHGLLLDLGPFGAYDKGVHFAYFLLLTLILARGLGLSLVPALAIAFGLGVCGEVVQSLMPNHEASLWDLAANCAGIATAVALIVLPLLLAKRTVSSTRS